MDLRFKYNYDRKTKWLTAAECLVLLAAAATIILFGGSDYMKAWLLTILVAMLALYILSIPRFLKVTGEELEIHCVIEMTRIAIEDISSVRKVTRENYGQLLVTLGSYGFFGYFGYYYSTRYWSSLKVYATELNNLVEIEDIYEQKYLVSCREADRLIEAIMQAKLEHAGERTANPEEE